MKEIYLAKHRCWLADRKDCSTWDQGVFSSLEKAKEFIEKLIKLNEYSEESYHDSGHWYFEVITLNLDSLEPLKESKSWSFDITGKLMRDCNEDDSFIFDVEDMADNYTGKYKKGDFVFIPATPWNIDHPYAPGNIAIIGEVPISYEEWKEKEAPLAEEWQEWESRYYVFEVLGTKGHRRLLFDHYYEKEMRPLKQKLPEDLNLLQSLSRHLKGELSLKEECLNDLWNDNKGLLLDENKIHLLKEDHFIS